MGNAVLGAYVVADLIFAGTGALMLGFSVIVQNFMFEVPTEGVQAVRNLLYQQFPLTGMRASWGPAEMDGWIDGRTGGWGCRVSTDELT